MEQSWAILNFNFGLRKSTKSIRYVNELITKNELPEKMELFLMKCFASCIRTFPFLAAFKGTDTDSAEREREIEREKE